jgi:putative peptidoglycan lipid II flippase
LILVKVLAPAFYARQDIRTPVKIAVVTLALTQLMNLAFMGPLQHAGLALATGLGSCLNAGLLYYLLHKRAIHVPQPGWGKFLLKLLAAVGLMALALWFAVGEAKVWMTATAPLRLARLGGLVLMGAAIYFAALWLLGFRMRDFSRHEAK